MQASTWLATGCVYLVPLAGALHIYRARRDRRRREAARAVDEARALGLTEPVSLHPSINPLRCLGCGACVRACPEGDVLAVTGRRAELVHPSSCVGHGACRTACPFDAITLVLGSERRGVEIPMLGPDFQTNVPGIYVAGELGGMGLVRNAVEQGRQAIEAIAAAEGGGGDDTALDVVIVGAGPAGISATLAARARGLRAVTLEQESLGGSVMHYPRKKLVTTDPVELPLGGRLRRGRIEKEELLAFWQGVVERAGVEIREGERVEAVWRSEDDFEVRSSRGSYRARAVLLAVGRRGTPRRLGVPGEELPKVVYRLVDAEQYRGQRVLVVGGGDSALEAAAALAEQPGTRVALSYRGDAFQRARRESRAAVEAAQAASKLDVRLGSEVVAIAPGSVTLRASGRDEALENDAVVLCLGGVLPTDFLREIGVEVEIKRGTPLASAEGPPRRRSERWRRSIAAS
jgi:thioredoxin reductase/NAD-dependent dihydropyrimidine dehydrogenase PreA subunit